MRTKEERQDFRRRMKYYEPASRFMAGGSLYGRSRYTPHTAGRVLRIFRTCIHLSFDSDRRWFHYTANANAYNRQTLYPLFAYQMRPTPAAMPPPPRKVSPVDEVVSDDALWLKAA